MPNAYMGMNYFNPYMYPNQMGTMPQMMPFPNYFGFQQNNKQFKDNNNNKNMPQPMFMPMYYNMGVNQMNKQNISNKK